MEPQAGHKFLDSGIELAALPLRGRPIVSAELRVLVGSAHESADQLGISHVVEQTINKGTSRRDGRALSDAFDELGIRWSSWSGREASGFQFTCLPEFLEQALTLHAEFLCSPVFPEESIRVAIEHAAQEISNLEDDPDELSAKLFSRQIYGAVLGRHTLGEKQTLEKLNRSGIEQYWRAYYQPHRMQLAIAGQFDVKQLEDQLNRLFVSSHQSKPVGRERFSYQFQAMNSHYHKELEQEHIGIGYPAATLDDKFCYAQKVAVGVLAGGMSARLFTEVREKQGLVYWVSAWTEHPRGLGMMFLGASTTPERCDKTFQTLLREVDRLEQDLDQAELQRSIKGLVARAQTTGDITRARCGELVDDLFHYGKIIPRQEKIARIQSVTVEEIKDYLRRYPRNQLNIMTLGPKRLTT